VSTVSSTDGEDAPRLEARELRVHFEGVKAVDGVDLVLERSEILGLIGPNGAGKTTLVNALTGFQRPTAGAVVVAGTPVTGWAPHAIARIGLARTFQAVRLFRGLSVFENVTLGAVGVGVPLRQAQRNAWELLERMDLGRVAMADAGAVPHGEERRIGIVRALAMKPTFLLLDEPAAGLNEGESAQLVTALREIRRDFGCGLMVIEHDMHVIMNLCERIQVIDHGKTISIGSPEHIRSDPAVQKAYLGTERKLEIVEEQLAQG
jgi:branched-chain amino acid transport system ATP-binding protein